MSLPTLRSLFAHKTWANNELFSTLATLPSRQAETLHASLRTLNHIYVVDRIFRAHLLGEPHPYHASNTPETPSLSRLRQDVAATDAWYSGYLAQLPAPALTETIAFNFTDGDAGTMSREEILLHVITHGAYHRGNVGQMLKSIAVTPPRDLYTKFLHLSEPARRP